MNCQVVNADWSNHVCARTDSAGVRCENLAPHSGTECRISDHTIRHSLAGTGYTCAEIAP